MNDVPEFHSARRTIDDDAKLHFVFDGEPFKMFPLKLTTTVAMLKLLESEDEDRSTIQAGSDTARLLMNIMEFIEDEAPTIDDPETDGGNVTVHLHGRSRLYYRLGDTADGFDLPDLLQVFKYLAGRMFPGRPTSGLPASGTEQPNSDSADSADSTDSEPAATSGKRKAPSLSR